MAGGNSDEALVSLDRCMDDFLTATRGLFNRYFRELDLEANFSRAWEREELYGEVEAALYRALVLLPCELAEIAYGNEHPQINVIPNGNFDLPVMVNREIDGGCWDYPLGKLPKDTTLHFLTYFDWSRIGRMDHRYVRAVVAAAPQCPDILRKHCLVETHFVTFVLGEQGDTDGGVGTSA